MSEKSAENLKQTQKKISSISLSRFCLSLREERSFPCDFSITFSHNFTTFTLSADALGDQLTFSHIPTSFLYPFHGFNSNFIEYFIRFFAAQIVNRLFLLHIHCITWNFILPRCIRALPTRFTTLCERKWLIKAYFSRLNGWLVSIRFEISKINCYMLKRFNGSEPIRDCEFYRFNCVDCRWFHMKLSTIWYLKDFYES